MAREMKDSGVEWIGTIPSNWGTDRLQWHLEEVNVSNNPVQTENILSLTIEAGVIPYEEKGNQGNKAKEDVSQYKVAFPDTLVVNSMNVIIGAVGISKYYGCVSPVYYVFKASEGTDLRYIYYLFTNVGFQKEMRKYAKGILEIRLRISSSDMIRRIVPNPEYAEQKRIADFLDSECTKIDEVIEQTRASIEKYKKLKPSVIAEAVTHGIRGTRPMKDSGVEWLGEVPCEWEVKRTKYFSDSFCKGNGITKEDVIEDGHVPCVRYGEIYTKFNQSFEHCFSYTELERIPSPQFFSKGDLLFTCTGELIEEIGKCIAYIGDEECLAGGDIIVMKHSQNPSFMSYVLNSNYAQAQKSCGKTKLKVVHISATEIKNIIIAVPSLKEQKEIAGYLDKKCAEIGTLIDEKDRMITELEKYKRSLIYECVTGKKEVLACQ